MHEGVAPMRAVLDTNLIASAPVFPGQTTNAIRSSWTERRLCPLVSATTVAELVRVLAYPKFRLTDAAQSEVLADYLPFCDVVAVPHPPPRTPPCRDPLDVPFLELALAGQADCLVTGDGDLLALAAAFACPIVTVRELLIGLGRAEGTSLWRPTG